MGADSIYKGLGNQNVTQSTRIFGSFIYVYDSGIWHKTKKEKKFFEKTEEELLIDLIIRQNITPLKSFKDHWK